jgi:hypothetical protein
LTEGEDAIKPTALRNEVLEISAFFMSSTDVLSRRNLACILSCSEYNRSTEDWFFIGGGGDNDMDRRCAAAG